MDGKFHGLNDGFDGGCLVLRGWDYSQNTNNNYWGINLWFPVGLLPFVSNLLIRTSSSQTKRTWKINKLMVFSESLFGTVWVGLFGVTMNGATRDFLRDFEKKAEYLACTAASATHSSAERNSLSEAVVTKFIDGVGSCKPSCQDATHLMKVCSADHFTEDQRN